MPIIQPYIDRLIPQGGIGAQASPNDFGAQVGAGIQRMGAGLEDVADSIYKVHEANDVTQVHVNAAQDRAKWTTNLQERENSATPGDNTFVPKLQQDMQDYFAQATNSASTPQGRRVYQSLAANMTSEFGQRAVAIQANLAAQEATTQNSALHQALGSTVNQDPNQVWAAIDQGNAAIDDPKSIYARVPQAWRNAAKQKLKQDLSMAAVKSLVQQDPQIVLGAVAPEQMEMFKPFEGLLKNNVVPGGKLSLSPAAVAGAQPVMAAAAVQNVNPNIMVAQTDTPGVVKEDPNIQAGAMAALLDRFGGSYPKALGAYHIGADNFAAYLQTHGDDWQAAVPTETSNYINTVMDKAGLVPTTTPTPAAETASMVQPVARQTPITLQSLPPFNNLSWEQQDQVINEGVRLQHLRLGMAERARAEQQIQLRTQQDGIMGDFLKKIVDPNAYGAFSNADVLGNQTLSWEQQQHLIDYSFTRQRELKASYDTKTNPGMVRNLMLQIHAADDDPTKTYNMDPVMSAYKAGSISTPEMTMLRNEVEQMRDGNNSNFQKQVNQVSNVVHDTFARSIQGQLQPGQAASAWYAFQMDMNQKIAAKRKANEDPSALIDPNSRDYLLKPERVQSFMDNNSVTLAKGAAKVAAGEAAKLPVGRDSVAVGELYRDVNGNTMRKR